MESCGNVQDHEISGAVSSVILGSEGFNSHHEADFLGNTFMTVAPNYAPKAAANTNAVITTHVAIALFCLFFSKDVSLKA